MACQSFVSYKLVNTISIFSKRNEYFNYILLVYMPNNVIANDKTSNKNQTIILNLNWTKAKYNRIYIPIYV